MKLFEGILGLIYPEKDVCIFCEKPHGFLDSVGLCPSCRSLLPQLPDNVCTRCGRPLKPGITGSLCHICSCSPRYFDESASAFEYSGIIQSVIYRLKYGGEKEISSALGMLMAEILAAKGWSIRAIVPVPIHPFRLAERGYNQSLLLAEEIGRECGIDVSDSVLVRNRNTMSQTQMPARERLANVRGAFGPGEDRRTVKGPLLLVDDIMTTGATLNECSRVLREMGAQKVYCLTAACPLYV